MTAWGIGEGLGGLQIVMLATVMLVLSRCYRYACFDSEVRIDYIPRIF